MPEQVGNAQVMLLAITGELALLFVRLAGLVAGLPPAPAEGTPDDLDEEPDVSTEVRTVVLCVMNDYLRPAAHDLLAVAAYRPEGETGGGGERPEEIEAAGNG
jgi:hypothetical protein